jgi:hypothetical protein
VIEPGTYDITIHQGATFSLDLQYKDSTGAGVNMTGYTVAGKLVNRLNTAAVASFQTSWVDQSNGKFRIKLSAPVTAGITSECQYDVLITEPGGDKYYILQGRAFLDPGFTGVP